MGRMAAFLPAIFWHPLTARRLSAVALPLARCREPQFRQANATMGLKRVEYLRQCAGLPAVPPAMRTPSVLLVNRTFDAGRHISGLDDVYDRLKRRLPPEVPVRLYLPRIESLEAQAAMFASANVLVVPHGAGNANFLFLPRTAGEMHAWLCHAWRGRQKKRGKKHTSSTSCSCQRALFNGLSWR